jgi:hypothetical protein
MLTIDSPNTDRTLLTIEEMRVAAGLAEGDSSRDTELTALNEYTSAIITAACNVARADLEAIPPTLREEEVTESYRLSADRGFVSLSRRPVVSITSVTEVGTLLDVATDYELEGVLLYRMSGDERTVWPAGDLTVIYVAGWEIVPPDLKYAALRFNRSEITQQGRPDTSLRRLRIEGVSEREWWVDPTGRTPDNVPPDVMDILLRGGYVRQWGWMR